MLIKKLIWRAEEVVYTVLMYAWGWFFPDPIILDGPGAIKKLPKAIKKEKKKRVLIVTDKMLMSLKLLDGLFKALDKAGIKYAVYDEVQPNPTVANVEAALAIYNENKCQAVIAVGGGSPMDCAKGVIARVARPNRPIKKMKGTFRVFMPALKMNGLFPPKLYACPTTAGTGSETTIAAVITDPDTHNKFPIMDPFIRAHYAVLDPELTLGLPKPVTSTTGMDAMTHAIEGYTNIWYNNKKFNDYGLKAIKLIFENLEEAYNNGKNVQARGNMLLASHYAGLCFTRGGVGYVHGIGHRLGGLYGVPHGLAMSVILPHVFSDAFLAPYTYKKLAEIADYVGIDGETKKEKAKNFMAEVQAMNDRMQIPTSFDCIKDEDVDWIAKECLAEVMPTYPVKKIFKKKKIKKFIRDELMAQ